MKQWREEKERGEETRGKKKEQRKAKKKGAERGRGKRGEMRGGKESGEDGWREERKGWKKGREIKGKLLAIHCIPFTCTICMLFGLHFSPHLSFLSRVWLHAESLHEA